MWHWKLFRPQGNRYCRFPSVFKSRRWRVSASFIWALHVLARQSGLQFSKELLIQWNMVKVMVVIVMSNFSVISQPTTNRAMVRVFFPIVPWDWCPHYYKNPLHVQLPMICLFYAIYYIIFIRILDYVIFLKKKLPQGLYFEKRVLFFFCIYRKRVRFSIILFINNIFHHSLQRIFFSLNILIRYFIYFYCALFWI